MGNLRQGGKEIETQLKSWRCGFDPALPELDITDTAWGSVYALSSFFSVAHAGLPTACIPIGSVIGMPIWT